MPSFSNSDESCFIIPLYIHGNHIFDHHVQSYLFNCSADYISEADLVKTHDIDLIGLFQIGREEGMLISFSEINAGD